MGFRPSSAQDGLPRMDFAQTSVSVRTSDRISYHVVTDTIQDAVAEIADADGLLMARTGHTSAALTSNEAEDRLLEDLIQAYTDLVPPDDGYLHDEIHLESNTQPNAFGHILSSLLRRPVVVPWSDGRLQTGTYEDVLLLEFDGPRTREIDVVVLT